LKRRATAAEEAAFVEQQAAAEVEQTPECEV